jgi:hypothetical protein
MSVNLSYNPLTPSPSPTRGEGSKKDKKERVFFSLIILTIPNLTAER